LSRRQYFIRETIYKFVIKHMFNPYISSDYKGEDGSVSLSGFRRSGNGSARFYTPPKIDYAI
ncbi:MAG: hypothetical protein R6V46_01830, partial [Desulfatiglandaceae bacterium]